MQVQKGQWNKNCGTKIVEKKLVSASAKRSAEQKLVGTVGHWVMGTPSASAKRSAEEKRQNKNGGTKIVEQKLFIIPSHSNKNWCRQCKCRKVSGTKIGEWNKNGRTKIGVRKKKRSVEQKLVSGTKTVEQKLVGGTKKGQRNKNW